MPAVSIREQVRKLVELQKIDLERYNLKRELKEKPALLETLKQKYEDSKADLKKLDEKIKAIQVDRKGKELELLSKEEAIAKANASLNQLKTNKEYTARLVEIEGMKADKSLIEEKILISYDEADTVNAQVVKEKAVLAENEKAYLSQKKQIEDAMLEIQGKVNKLEELRHGIIPGVDKNNLLRYEKILEHKDGWAIVPIKSNTCGGCYMHIPQQVFNEIKMHDKWVFCDMCARILYLEDDL